MFENVLVGVDGKSGGRDALALASRLSGADGRLALAHVHGARPRPLQALQSGGAERDREASVELLERERAAASADGAELVSLAAHSPGAALHRRAEQQGADLLVVGSCSRGILGRVMLGDDTRAALNGAPCAVAIACLGYAEAPVPLARIGVGYDGSRQSEAALAVARELAAANRASIHALEVVSLPTYASVGVIPPVSGDSIDVMLGEARDRLAELAGVSGRAVYGLTGEELAAFGDEVDLLVVGSRGYGPVRRLMLGSTAEFLQRHARCSLLVLPRAARA
jgi:nucleotide-binding universal stress UspA family protein